MWNVGGVPSPSGASESSESEPKISFSANAFCSDNSRQRYTETSESNEHARRSWWLSEREQLVTRDQRNAADGLAVSQPAPESSAQAMFL